tara:strand:+ start:809 stop:1471 length:663 start_codon:yes stop_codon:yes gene_type:complete
MKKDKEEFREFLEGRICVSEIEHLCRSLLDGYTSGGDLFDKGTLVELVIEMQCDSPNMKHTGGVDTHDFEYTAASGNVLRVEVKSSKDAMIRCKNPKWGGRNGKISKKVIIRNGHPSSNSVGAIDFDLLVIVDTGDYPGVLLVDAEDISGSSALVDSGANLVLKGFPIAKGTIIDDQIEVYRERRKLVLEDDQKLDPSPLKKSFLMSLIKLALNTKMEEK